MLLWVDLSPWVIPTAQATPITGMPTMTGAMITQILAAWRSPLSAYATDVWQEGLDAGINPAFALAVWAKESQFGTTGAAVRTHNMGNLVCDAVQRPPAIGCDGRWATYQTWREAISDWYAYIARRYISRGLTTVEAIIPVYAPASDGNVPAEYIRQVVARMQQWSSGTIGQAPQSSGESRSMMDDWLRRIVDQAIYTVELMVAAMLWVLNQSGLLLALMLDRLRAFLVQNHLAVIIQYVADQVQPLLKPVFALALTLGLLAAIALPIVRVTLFNFRRGFAVALLAVALLPLAGQAFQEAETLRGELGSLLYRGVFDRFDGAFVTNPSGVRDIGPLTMINERSGAEATYHALDVAAAFLYAQRSDIDGTSLKYGLPAAFADTYFRAVGEIMASGAPAQRAQAIMTGAAGMGRMVYGLPITAFGLVEAVVNLLFTLAFGMLVIALIISVLFSFFAMLEGLWTSVLYECVSLFVSSWSIAICEALLLALVIDAAQAGSGALVLGFGFFGLMLNWVFLRKATKLIVGSFGTLALRTAGMGGSGEQAVQTMLSTATGAALTAATGGLTYGAGVALGLTPGLNQLGSLAAAMNGLNFDTGMGQGFYDVQGIGHGDATNPRLIRTVQRHHVERAADQPSAANPRSKPQLPSPTEPLADAEVLHFLPDLEPVSVMQAGDKETQRKVFGAATGTVRRILDPLTNGERRTVLEAIDTVVSSASSDTDLHRAFRTADQSKLPFDALVAQPIDADSQGMRQIQALLGPNHPLQNTPDLQPLVEVALGSRDERVDIAAAMGRVMEQFRTHTAREPLGEAARAVAWELGLQADAFGSRTSAINSLIQTGIATHIPSTMVESFVLEVTHSADEQPSDTTANAIRSQLRSHLTPRQAEATYQTLRTLVTRVPHTLAQPLPPAASLDGRTDDSPEQSLPTA